MNKVVAQVLKHLAREFINHPQVRAKAKELAEVGYSTASKVITEWGARRRLKPIPSSVQAVGADIQRPEANRNNNMPAKKSSAKKSSGSSSKKSGGAKKSTTSKRTLIEPNPGDKRYVRRDAKGQFKDVVDVGRSLAADRRSTKTKVKKGQGDRGDVAR